MWLQLQCRSSCCVYRSGLHPIPYLCCRSDEAQALSRIEQNCIGIVILTLVNFFLWPVRAAENVRVISSVLLTIDLVAVVLHVAGFGEASYIVLSRESVSVFGFRTLAITMCPWLLPQAHTATGDCIALITASLNTIMDECFVMLNVEHAREIATDPAARQALLRPEAEVIACLATIEDKCAAVKVRSAAFDHSP